MSKGLICVFGYILLSSLAFKALMTEAPRWAVYPFMVAFLFGWVFVIGFATCESDFIKNKAAQGVEFIKSWLSVMGWILLAAVILAPIAYLS